MSVNQYDPECPHLSMFSGEDVSSCEDICQEAIMKSVKYLEQLKQQKGLTSDRQLALMLGMGTSTISQYMKGQRVMDDEACLAVAIALEFDEHKTMQLIMAAGIDRAEKAGQQSLWTVFSQRMAATAASALIVAGVTLFLTPQNAEARTYSRHSTPTSEQFILCKIERAPGSRPGRIRLAVASITYPA
jgi:transcriptional regulator with XRE-family HTH domain